MTEQSDTARGHELQDDGDGEAAVHARIAAQLAALSTEQERPPPPYARRHLARHAALGHVLDDARVPPQALAWDTGGGIRALLHHTPAGGPRHWLTAWSAIEPYLREAPLPSRMASLHLAHTALTYPDTPRTRMPPEAAPPADSPLTVHFANWRLSANIWATLPATPTRLLTLDHPRRGLQVAVATTTGTLEFLDAATAHPIGTPLAAHTGEIRSVHLSQPGPDQRQYLVTASTDGTVRLWDAHRHAALGCHTDSTWFDDALCCFDDRGDLTVRSVNGRSELTGWAPPAPPRTLATAPAVLRGALATLVDTDGERVLVHAARDLTVHRLDGTVRAVHPLPTPARTVTAGAEPGLFYCGHADGSITSWSATGGQLPATAPGHGEPVKDLCLLALDDDAESTVLAAARGRTVTLWEPATDTVAELRGHTDTVTALAALPESPDRPGALLSGAADATLRLWTAADIGVRLTAGHTPAPRRASGTALWHSDSGPLIATAHDTTVRLTATRTGRTTTALTGPEPVLALTWARRAAQHLLLSADTTGTVSGWDPAAPGLPPLTPLDCGAPTRLLAACASADGALALLLTASDDYRVRLWDLHTATGLRTWDGHTMSVKALAAACTGDGRPWLASAGTEGVVRLWDPATPDDSADRIHCDQGILHALALNTEPADGLPPFLVTAGDQADIRLWDLATTQPIGPRLTGHHAPVHAVATFTAERRTYVVSASRDGIVRLWDAATCRPLLTVATATPLTWLDATPHPGTATVDLTLAGPAGTALTSLDLAHPALAG
ncbi:hypothetical protein OKJ48_11290 [Streptomyces kunmingensis]|uniref:WD40 repeat n=1 Tax=Streptomyces kunmingensis TaxID=68225 RepID=A0ABU6C883_9ACTN|nr:hypothetical protein [Streptomyces kunmingensis]MEB3960822.1 hypothetical protein [Streptomyces kunmingensis]